MSAIQVRRYDPLRDLPAVLGLGEAGLGWRPGDPNEQLLRWKHHDSAFGPSPAWVATSGGRVVGFRAFLRWTFLLDGVEVRAVRAVDTVTHPDYQGKGIFRLLTMTGVEELRAEGVAFVFNTPNDQSRPGYLKMGWRVLGRLPVVVRPRGLRSLPVMRSARVPAEFWSTATSTGQPPDGRSPDLCHVPEGHMGTAKDGSYLAWRYGADFLQYRLFGNPREGEVFFRVRRRGAASEVVVCEHHGLRAGGLRALLRSTHADYALALGGVRRPRGMSALPAVGPVLTWRPLGWTEPPPIERWALTLGDVELF